MKTAIALLFLFILQQVAGQGVIQVSSAGIGEIKINMTLEQVEKITGQTISLKKNSEENYAMDTAVVTYKGVQVTIEFLETTEGENNKPVRKVYGLEASHPSLKTRSGIELGSDKFEIVKKLDGMYLELQPHWRYDGKPDKKKYSLLRLTDGDNGTELLMFFEDNKLTGFKISVYEGC